MTGGASSMTKLCRNCDSEKSTAEFSKDRCKKDGLAVRCKACHKAAQAIWRAENQDKVRARQAKYRAENIEKRRAYSVAWNAANKERKRAASARWNAENAEKAKAYGAAWYAENADKVKARVAAYRAANPEDKERKKARNAAWRRANPEVCRTYCHNRRARKRTGGGALSLGLAEKLFSLQKGKCACCAAPLGSNYHMDHIKPLSLGGTNTDDNIQLLRPKCNLQKSKKDPLVFMQSKGFLI